jgi:hypothetical protein
MQFAKAGNYYRLEATISRLLPREVPEVVAAFSQVWTKPEEVDSVPLGTQSGEALILTLTADHEISLSQRPSDIARLLTYAIWQRLDRYTKVTVETTYLGESPDTHFEFGEDQYASAYGARFEN